MLSRKPEKLKVFFSKLIFQVFAPLDDGIRYFHQKKNIELHLLLVLNGVILLKATKLREIPRITYPLDPYAGAAYSFPQKVPMVFPLIMNNLNAIFFH